jgi:alpha-galactosidase
MDRNCLNLVNSCKTKITTQLKMYQLKPGNGMKQIHYFNAIIILWLFSCNPQKKPIEPKIADVALTPPMGWNSYDCFGATVNEEEVKANAQMMAVHLKEAGWEYIVIDYLWFYPFPGAMHAPNQLEDFTPNFRLDNMGRLLPALDRYPSSKGSAGFKPLADYVHNLGLKFGIHVMRGVPREAVAKKLPVGSGNITADMIAEYSDTCEWSNSMYGVDAKKPGAQEYYDNLFKLYASWGVDFVKVDDIWRHMDEIELVRNAIDKCGRNMVFSVSAGDTSQIENAELLKAKANMWRISGDFWDNWEYLKGQFKLCHLWERHIGPGHWPDADMIPIGMLAHRGPEGKPAHRSFFTWEEKKTLFSLWAIFRSPLMYGGDLTLVERPEMEMLQNKAVFAVNQNSKNNRQLFRKDDKVAWTADVPSTNDKYIALFNLGDTESEIEVNFADLGIESDCRVTDLWSGLDLGTHSQTFKQSIVPHGSGLYKFSMKD